MTEDQQPHGAAGFAAALAAALGPSLENAGGAGTHDAWQATGPRPAPEPAPAALHFALTFAGELAGECFVTVPEQDAAGLAPQGDSQETLRAVLETAGNAVVAGMGGRGITVSARAMTELPADALPVAAIEATAGEPRALAVSFDPQLLSALPVTPAPGSAAESDAILNGNLGLVMDVELKVTLRFGQRQMPLRDVLELASGSVVELDRQVDEPVELILEGRVIARGEAVIVDGNYGIRVTEVLQPVSA